MDVPALHAWDLTPREAIALQKSMASAVDLRKPLCGYTFVAGADCSYQRFCPDFYAAVVVLRSDNNWTIVDAAEAHGRCSFPYVPGLLSFREVPIVLEAFAKLKVRPDVVMCDGQGYAHPRRFGLACHLGTWLSIPTLGCAKTRLIGTHREPGKKPGSLAPLRDKGEVIGSVVRTKFNTKPLYVSVGNHIDLPSAVRVVLESCQGYRIPEPTRQAHIHVNAMRRRVSAGAGEV